VTLEENIYRKNNW